jgi:hypothetical protein
MPELLQILQLRPRSSIYTSVEFKRALSAAVSWPCGLELLLSNLPGGLSILDENESFLILDALGCGNGESIHVLLQNNASITSESWITACDHQDLFEVETRKEMFAYMATYLAKSGCSLPLYLTPNLSRTAAQCLWDVGFPLKDDACDSPLWFQPISVMDQPLL